MPELPDLLYIQKELRRAVAGRSIRSILIKEPILFRSALKGGADRVLEGKTIKSLEVRGPFLRFGLSGDLDLVVNLMLSGRFQIQSAGEKAAPALCCSMVMNNGTVLNLCDDKKMAKAYLVPSGDYSAIPRYASLGISVIAPEFTLAAFRALVDRHRRKQVRVFINDQTILSAIGNAYADEILFEARIHPKTIVARLSPEQKEALHTAILSTLAWGIEKVEAARQPIHIKVRDHMKVRGRRGEPCPRCGTTIRREGVRGHDVFFCPSCQPPARRLFIDWRTLPPKTH